MFPSMSDSFYETLCEPCGASNNSPILAQMRNSEEGEI